MTYLGIMCLNANGDRDGAMVSAARRLCDCAQHCAERRSLDEALSVLETALGEAARDPTITLNHNAALLLSVTDAVGAVGESDAKMAVAPAARPAASGLGVGGGGAADSDRGG